MREARNAWTLENALPFLHSLRDSLTPEGFGVGLTGSVLFAGQSTCDLDVLIYPLDSSVTPDIGGACRALRAQGLQLLKGRDTVTAHWRAKGSRDAKHVEIWTHLGRRVDFFFLPGEPRAYAGG